MNKAPYIPAQSQGRMPAHEAPMDPAPDCAPRFPGVGKLNDKVAFISGGDSGLGRALTLLFAREGAGIAIAYFDADEDAKEAQRLVEAEGITALLIRGDLGNRDNAFDTVAQTVAEFGGLDVLINNAAQQ